MAFRFGGSHPPARNARDPLRSEGGEPLKKRANARDALRAGGARTLQIIWPDTTECVHRQASIGHELRETVPADWLRAWMRGGCADGRKRREIGANFCGEFQFLRVVTRRTDPRTLRQGSLVQFSQLCGAQVQADSQLARKLDVVIDQQ